MFYVLIIFKYKIFIKFLRHTYDFFTIPETFKNHTHVFLWKTVLAL